MSSDAIVLRAAGDGLWTAAAPLRALGVEVGRNMAVVRLGGGELLVHSPAPLGDELKRRLDALGHVRFVVPASALHGHVFMEQYAAAYPDVELFAAPGLRKRRTDLRFAGDLHDRPDPRWADELDQTTLDGHRFLTEVVFLHRASRTLIVGDCVWNVTPRMPKAARLWAGWRAGVHPTPFFRWTFRDRDAAQRSVLRILEWDFDRIVIGHGEPVESGGREAFRAGYAWLL
jgi:hypothetical protein